MPEQSFYALLKRSKYFKTARILAVIALPCLVAFCWNVANDNWGLAVGLGVPLWALVAGALEGFVKAWQVTALARELATRVQAQKETSAEGEPDISDDSKLEMCQFYAFLYALFALKKCGESTLGNLLGIPARRYREWIKALAGEQLQLVAVTAGKTRLAVLSFDEVLVRLAEYNGQPEMWDFPRRVYANPRNWRQFDQAALVLEPGTGRVAALNMQRAAAKAPLPYPLYPHSLNDLNFEPGVEVG
jgi:hypothetical protein